MKLFINNIYNSIVKVTGRGKHFLHEPFFDKNENKFVCRAIDSKFISTAGENTHLFEKKISNLTKSKYCVSTVSGTSAIQIALLASGIKPYDEVLVPSLTFIGTANAISHCGAIPHFIDSEIANFGVDVEKLRDYLKKSFKIKKGTLINKKTRRKVKAIVPVHVFGHACSINEINKIAKEFKLKVIEDAAEALGSYQTSKHLGTYSLFGCLSFNGNKIITTGGGGAIITDSYKYFKIAKHLATTAKIPHKYKYIHDKVGFNYRMPSLNASIGIAQLLKLKKFLSAKRQLYYEYEKSFSNLDGVKIYKEAKNSKSNYWLQTIVLDDKYKKFKEKIIKYCISKNIFVRPSWTLLSELKPYKYSPKMNLSGAKNIEKSIINLPSSQSIILKKK